MVEYTFYADINFWAFYLALFIPYLGFTISVRLGKIKLKKGFNKNWFLLLGLVVGGLIGFITYPAEDIVQKLGYGAMVYGLFFVLIPKAIIEQEILPRILELGVLGTSIEKLKLNDDYINLFNGAGISTLENLTESDIRNLSDETGLSIETIIEFRAKAKKILKSSKKKKKK